jgi:hypothetical protein
VYSQFGEDGVTREVLRRISLASKLNFWCVEFGAWDGMHLSNTCALIKEQGYNAVLIEGNKKRVNQLRQNFPEESVIKLERFVQFEGGNSLDNILASTQIPLNFDFLSIDIDGNDYHIFESLQKYVPKVVCIEFNPTIPNMIDYVNPRDFKIKKGSSARSLVRLAISKNYKLVASTKANLFFVHLDYVDLVIETPATLEELNQIGNDPQIIWSGFDGTLMSNKSHLTLAWHIALPIERVQIVPRFLRQFSEDYNFFKKLIFLLFLFKNDFKQTCSRLNAYLKRKKTFLGSNIFSRMTKNKD